MYEFPEQTIRKNSEHFIHIHTWKKKLDNCAPYKSFGRFVRIHFILVLSFLCYIWMATMTEHIVLHD